MESLAAAGLVLTYLCIAYARMNEWRLVSRWDRIHHQHGIKCCKCHYSLMGLERSGVGFQCPECGHAEPDPTVLAGNPQTQPLFFQRASSRR